jgi:hypothetical protein
LRIEISKNLCHCGMEHRIMGEEFVRWTDVMGLIWQVFIEEALDKWIRSKVRVESEYLGVVAFGDGWQLGMCLSSMIWTVKCSRMATLGYWVKSAVFERR